MNERRWWLDKRTRCKKDPEIDGSRPTYLVYSQYYMPSLPYILPLWARKQNEIGAMGEMREINTGEGEFKNIGQNGTERNATG